MNGGEVGVVGFVAGIDGALRYCLVTKGWRMRVSKPAAAKVRWTRR
jgi:hypothetical protein